MTELVTFNNVYGEISDRIDDHVTFFSTAKVELFNEAKARYNRTLDLNAQFRSLKLEIAKYNAAQTEDKMKFKLSKNAANFESKLVAIESKFYSLEEEKSAKTTAISQPAGVKADKTGMGVDKSYDKFHSDIKRVPIFNGAIKEFRSWKEIFDVVVHTHAKATEIEKFIAFKAKLSGDALAVINHLELIATNYQTAYDLLVKRYNAVRINASYYLNEILNFSNANSKPNMQTFLELHKNCITSFQQLKLKNSLGYIFFHITYNNLNVKIRQEFDLKNEIAEPTADDLFTWLEKKADSERISAVFEASKTSKPDVKNSKSLVQTNSTQQTQQSSGPVACKCCQDGTHPLWNCSKFKQLSVPERFNFASKNDICYKCLKSKSHRTCRSANASCQICSRKGHDKLLCRQTEERAALSNTTTPNNNVSKNSEKGAGNSKANTTINKCQNQEVLLGTIKVYVKNCFGEAVMLKGLVDQGSQLALITEKCAKTLGLQPTKVSGQVVGISGSGMNKLGTVDIKLFKENPNLVHNTISLDVGATIVKNIPGHFPGENVPPTYYDKVKHLPLADNQFYKKEHLSFLLGNKEFFQLLLLADQSMAFCISGPPNLLNTGFGYLAMGPVDLNSQNSYSCLTLDVHNKNSCHDLERIFESNNDLKSSIKSRSEEDEFVERHFKNTFKRVEDGSYMVEYPERPEAPPLGVNNRKVLSQYLSQEQRLKTKFPEVFKKYNDFLQQYLDAGHMELDESDKQSGYFLPHHAVFKRNPANEFDGSKIRVVFNGSAKDNLGLSLNDRLHTGPNLLKDISTLITNFRLKPVALCTDVEKMYRGFWVSPHQRHLQRILWRQKIDVLAFKLKTITYGINVSPFSAMRALFQLADDEEDTFPLASAAIKKGFYVDDMLYAVSSVEEAEELKRQLIALFATARLRLKKWACSHPQVLHDISDEDKEVCVGLDDNDTTKVLGLRWAPDADHFLFFVKSFDGSVTKRSVLSHVAKIYDPLCYLGPVNFWAKVFIQSLWKLKLHWDKEIPFDLQQEWLTLVKKLPALEDVRIPRHVPVGTGQVRLLVFGDASEKGFGAVAYIHIVTNGKSSTFLLKSCSRVAPVKNKQTVPRLELNASVLVAELSSSLCNQITDIAFDEILLLSDSKIVLAWIKSCGGKQESYVVNRVQKIRALTDQNTWHYVNTKHNACDILSRGCLPDKLVATESWWNGPSFLRQPREKWPLESSVEELPEVMSESVEFVNVIVAQPVNYVYKKHEKFSWFKKSVRIHAYTLRFLNNFLKLGILRSGPLTVEELNHAQIDLLQISQRIYFDEQISELSKPEKNRCKRPLKGLQSLSPFLDTQVPRLKRIPGAFASQILRVGGRLSYADLPFDKRHPIILSKRCPLSKKIIRDKHRELGHVGSSTVAAALREKFWITSSLNMVKAEIGRCLRCLRFNGKAHQPPMANLPASRVQHVRVFTNVGTDFAGPFLVKSSLLRRVSTTKAYFVVFICQTYRCIHTELCSDLTTDCFMAALHRFMSRRGKPAEIFSDNGSNYIGAANELKEVAEFLRTNENDLIQDLAALQVKWSFNPPSAPNFGGSWEIHVKLVKRLLYKMIGNTILSYEELNTILCRVESIINSRPLCRLSSEPDNLDFLTPGHFIMQTSPQTIPELAITQKSTLKNRWLMIQQIVHQIWDQWSREYLMSIAQRQKWTKGVRNPAVGEVVYVMEADCAPLSWPLGRIVAVHPSRDGVVRVVTVQMHGKEFVRPCNKLILFPLQETSEIDLPNNDIS